MRITQFPQFLCLAIAISPVFAAENSADSGVKPQVTQSPNNDYLPALPTPDSIRAGVRDGLASTIPLSAEEIQWIKKQADTSQYMLYKDVRVKTSSRVIAVSVDPGSTPPLVRVRPGYVTAVSIVGKDGVAWPVITVGSGAGKAFSVEAPSLAMGQSAGAATGGGNGAPMNLITIQPSYFGANTNIMLTLKGLDTPMILMAESDKPDGGVVDSHVTLRLNRNSPDAPPPVVIPPPPSPLDAQLLQFLENTPPKGAQVVSSGAPDIQVWRWNESVIVRSARTLILPGWIAAVKQDGYTVYHLPPTEFITVRNTDGGASHLVLGKS